MSSKFLKTILPVVAVVFLAAGYLYLSGKMKLNNEPVEIEEIVGTTQETETAEAETASWKTYKSEKYGFEVKYPSNMTAKYIPTAYMEGLNDVSDADGVGPGVTFNNGLFSVNIIVKNNNNCLEGTCLLREVFYKEYCDFHKAWFTKHSTTYCKINPDLGSYLRAIEKRRGFDITNNNNEKWYSVGFDLSPDYIFILNGKITITSFSTSDLDKIFVDAVYEHYDNIKIKQDGKNTAMNNVLSKSGNILNEREDVLLKIISTFKFTE